MLISISFLIIIIIYRAATTVHLHLGVFSGAVLLPGLPQINPQHLWQRQHGKQTVHYVLLNEPFYESHYCRQGPGVGLTADFWCSFPYAVGVELQCNARLKPPRLGVYPSGRHEPLLVVIPPPLPSQLWRE